MTTKRSRSSLYCRCVPQASPKEMRPRRKLLDRTRRDSQVEKIRMQEIRVCTYDGPGAKPIIRTVPWPKVGKKAALIKIGACGQAGADAMAMKTVKSTSVPW